MIGFIGFGEAAYEMAKGLTQEGVTGIIAYDPLLIEQDMSHIIKEKMTAVGVVPCADAKEVAIKRELLIVAVPAQFALAACEAVEEDLTASHLYVDVSASSPTVKKNIAAKIAKSNGKSVDAAMLGPLTVNQHKVPMFISGDGAHEFKKRMDPYGMNITVVSEQAGDASSIKLMRSIYMKGTAALLMELLEASRELKVEDQVLASIKETMEAVPFEQVVNQLVTGTSIHSERRGIELEGSLELLEQLSINSVMTQASKTKLDYVSQLGLRQSFKGNRPSNWQDVIDEVKVKLQASKAGEYHASK